MNMGNLGNSASGHARSGSGVPTIQGLTCDKLKNCLRATMKCIPAVTSGVKVTH